MKVIITGGAGFIGSAAVKHFLNAGDDVVIVDNLTYAGNLKNTELCTFIKLDVCDSKGVFKVINDYEPDFIVHFAAETHVDNSITNCKNFARTNLEGTISILDACRKTGTKLCHVSTDEVYGPADKRPFTENDSLRPMNPYSSTKAAADMMVQSYRNTYGIDYIIVRPSNNYGPGQHKEKFIPKLLDCIENNLPFPLYGVGDQEREWTFVKDTAKRIRSLITCKKTEWNSAYNLSSGITLKNIDAASKIIEIYNKEKNKKIKIEDVVKFSTDRPGHDKKYWISSERLDTIVGGAYTTFDAGIRAILKDK